MPFFSVVVSLFNKEKSIGNTIKSVLDQTFMDYEIIIINDGSTDRSEEIVREFNDQKIKLYSTKNQGVSQARNLGIEKSNGKLIAFLDADDFWFPEHLFRLQELYYRFPDCGFYATNYEMYFSSKKTIPNVFIDIPKTEWRGIVKDFFKSSMINRITLTSAIAVPKNIFNEIGNFDSKITLGAGEDIDLWIRIALKYKVAFDNQVSTRYQLDSENRVSLTKTLTRNFAKFEQFEAEEKTNLSLKKFLDLYRTEFAIKHKLAGDLQTFEYYKKQINPKNIPQKTKFLMQLPVFVLRNLFIFKKFLERKNIIISIYN